MTQLEKVQGLSDGLVAAGAPGAAAWVQDDSGARQAASGAADRRTGRPMRPELHFRAGSLTKSLVATVVLQLVAEGRLSLQDSLQRWLHGTSFPETSPGIPSPRSRGYSLPLGPQGERWTARCWTLRPRTPRGLGRRARWCPTWRT